MNAQIKPNIDGKRTPLVDVIPLSHPYTVYIETTRYCNLKCFYCLLTTRDDPDSPMKELGLKVEHMNLDLFPSLVKQLKDFPPGIKRIVFSGLGEPLMNPNLPNMIRQVADAGIADRIDVITNGLLLTKKKIEEILSSGVTNINISIQGINADQYLETGKKQIDFEKLVENLTYLYKNKGTIQIYIKAIDATLKSEEDKKLFFDIFGKISDKIYIEHLIVMQQQMNDLKEIVDPTKGFYNDELNPDRKVCAQSFYFLQIGCNFDVFPCPNPGLPISLSMGNMRNASLLEIWNGKKRKEHLIKMLKKEKDLIPECKGCTTFNCVVDQSEYLDNDTEKLLMRFM